MDNDGPKAANAAQEAMLRRKYGGLLPKKPPLMSKDHERAFFDSADWALNKQKGGVSPKPKVEPLRPKLEPTHHEPLPARRPVCDGDQEDVSGTDGASRPREQMLPASENVDMSK